MGSAIIINANKQIAKIEPDVYGHFSEHLGRCIYDGIWVGKDSPIPNINGYRTSIVEALKKMRIPNLRWPGGCFADEYHWKDGIGPQATRKRMVNTHWGGVVEDNSFGTHEFLDLCELLDCKAYISGNVGSGSIQEMSEWVEYITFDGDSPMARLRAANGRDKPWKLPYFGVGNENWGCGGNMTADHYADVYRNYQTYVRKYGPDKVYKIACGPSGDDWNWTDVLMRKAAGQMDGLSLHYYTITHDWSKKGSATEFDRAEWYKTLGATLRMEDLVRRHAEVMDKYDSAKRVGLIVDEWGTWFDVEPGTNPGFLYQQNTVRDALVAGINLNIFNNHADRVKMANIAQLVNVLQAPILTEGAKIVLTPTYHVFEMYKEHQGATALNCSVASEVTVDGSIGLPTLQASASLAANGTYLVTVCNTDPERAVEVPVSLSGVEGKIASATARTLAGAAMSARNTFDKPDAVSPTALPVRVAGGRECVLTLPARSVTAITVTLA
jgi:alpha-N-arabinofuranosidase